MAFKIKYFLTVCCRYLFTRVYQLFTIPTVVVRTSKTTTIPVATTIVARQYMARQLPLLWLNFERANNWNYFESSVWFLDDDDDLCSALLAAMSHEPWFNVFRCIFVVASVAEEACDDIQIDIIVIGLSMLVLRSENISIDCLISLVLLWAADQSCRVRSTSWHAFWFRLLKEQNVQCLLVLKLVPKTSTHTVWYLSRGLNR
jgi:hypothetical protein